MRLLLTLLFGLFTLCNCLDINNDIIRFVIALKQQNTDKLQKKVLDVSDPNSPNYGKYWSTENILNLVSPSKEEVKPVFDWLNYHHVNYNYFGDSFECFSSLETAGELFDTNILKNKKNYYIYPEDYKIPRRFNSIIEFVEGISNKNYPNAHFIFKGNPDDGLVGREVINRLYNITESVINNNNVSVCSIEYQDNQGFSQDDLYTSQFYNGEKNKTVSPNDIVGKNFGTDTESQLDMQMMSQTAENVELWYWEEQLWLYSFSIKFFNTKIIPDVISMSWGWSERDQCSIVSCNNETSSQYVNRVNVEYAKIALRGTTISVSSGDAGSPGRTNEDCSNQTYEVNPVFPGSSPWVTSVSATFIDKSNEKHNWNTKLCKIYGCPNGTTEDTVNFNQVGWTTGGGFGIYNTEFRRYCITILVALLCVG